MCFPSQASSWCRQLCLRFLYSASCCLNCYYFVISKSFWLIVTMSLLHGVSRFLTRFGTEINTLTSHCRFSKVFKLLKSSCTVTTSTLPSFQEPMESQIEEHQFSTLSASSMHCFIKLQKACFTEVSKENVKTKGWCERDRERERERERERGRERERERDDSQTWQFLILLSIHLYKVIYKVKVYVLFCFFGNFS